MSFLSFEQQIQRWVSIDNQIKIYNDKLHELREEKSKLNENIIKHVETNNLKNSSVQISDGKLRFVTSNSANPLSFKYVEKSLGDIIKNQNQVKQIVSYLKEHREIKTITEVKRFSTI